jgi:hypothetical protein
MLLKQGGSVSAIAEALEISVKEATELIGRIESNKV